MASWPRLVLACRLTDAIWRDDVDAVCELVGKHPQLVREMANGNERSNWGPPLSYAANLGRDRVIRALAERGAADLEHALDRASLQGKIETARMLHRMMGEPQPRAGCLNGPAYTLNVPGIQLMLELGAQVHDEEGGLLAPVDVVLETDSRTPAAKHQILEAFVRAGVELPDTPTMAVHRGRIDLLEEHLRRDPTLLMRTFTHEEIYPPEFGCHDEVQATQGTPLAGTTLLHLCVDYDEQEIARWLIARGMPVDVKAAVDANGFGGHTALFGTVVSQPNFWMNYQDRPQVCAAHAALARPRGGPQRAGFAPQAASHGLCPRVRHVAARIPRHHAAGLGRAVPREGLCQPTGAAIDSQARRPRLTEGRPPEWTVKRWANARCPVYGRAASLRE